MDIEEIYINLKVLESLNKNQKLISRGQYINVETNSIIPEFIRRWHRQDNRNETLNKINLIVNSAIEYIQNDQNPNKIKIITDNNNNNDAKNISPHEMKSYLKKSLHGISNLKETYATCSQTCARIDVIINKINHVLQGGFVA